MNFINRTSRNMKEWFVSALYGGDPVVRQSLFTREKVFFDFFCLQADTTLSITWIIKQWFHFFCADKFFYFCFIRFKKLQKFILIVIFYRSSYQKLQHSFWNSQWCWISLFSSFYLTFVEINWVSSSEQLISIYKCFRTIFSKV